MEVFSTYFFMKRKQKLIARRPNLEKRIAKQLVLLRTNVKHPSLKLHKLNGARKDYHSIWVEGNIRIILKFTKKGIVLGNIVTHDEY